MNNSVKQVRNKIQLSEKETFLAMVSHDLKNPVTSGIMVLKLLNNPDISPLNPYQKELLDSVMMGLMYMNDLIENLLDRYRFEHEVYTVKKSPVDFIKFLNTILEESKYLFMDKNQTIRLCINTNKRMISMEELEMKRVINNLLINSSKYSPAESEIIINLIEDSNGIKFSIENTGHGFQLRNQQDIFEKFVSCHENSKTIASGLGLYIAKRIIDAHQGTIYAESVVDKFTRITFTLPQK